MSWETLTRGQRAGKTGIWCALSAKDVRITFGKDTFEALKLTEGCRVEVCVGKDDHLGRLRLRVTQQGYMARKVGGKSASLSISFRKWAGLMAETCAPVQMPFKVVGDGVLEVTLPYWGQPHKLRAQKIA